MRYWVSLLVVLFAVDAWAQCADPAAADFDASFNASSGEWEAGARLCSRVGDEKPIESLELVYNGTRVGCVAAQNGMVFPLSWSAALSGSLSVTVWDELACTGVLSANSVNLALVSIAPPAVCPDPAAPDIVAVWDGSMWTATVASCPQTEPDSIQSLEVLYNGARVGCLLMANDENLVVQWSADSDGTMTGMSWSNPDCTGISGAVSPNAATVTLGPPLEPELLP